MARLIDLSLPLHEGMLTFPAYWHPVVEVTILGRHNLEGRASRKITFGTHTGTHMDAPLHFIENGSSIDQVPLEVMVGEAVVIDLTHKKDKEPITAEDLEKSGAGPKVQKCGRVVLHTGWAEKWWNTTKYFSDRPYMTREACEWLVKKGVKLVAFDMPDFDDPRDSVVGKPAPLHLYMFQNNVIVVESVTNLSQLKKDTFTLVALPLKILGSDASPARVIAIEE